MAERNRPGKDTTGPLTAGGLVAWLLMMPQDVTVVFQDSQNGERRVRSVRDTLSSIEGVRVVRLDEYPE